MECPRVQTEFGTLEGVASDGVAAFLGVPYAAPPVNELRWRVPQPVQAWNGVRPAREFAWDCLQKPAPGDAAPSTVPFSEDCLYLNVWGPTDAAGAAPLPVLVWIHGGGFVNGGSSPAIYHGRALAQAGLVVVTLNYRLGRLGFFAHPALSAAAEGALGNYGLLDQLAALRWIHRNISAFDGDPTRVTLVGESAGGISVIQHLTSSEARGLFQRAVVMSGGGRAFLIGGRNLAEGSGPPGYSAEACGLAFARSSGIKGSGADALAALRALPAEAVNGDLSMETLMAMSATYAGGPMLDGETLPATPQSQFQAGRFGAMPLLIGTTGDDLPLVFPPRSNEPLAWFGSAANQARQAYDPETQLTRPEIVRRIAVDLSMHEPARFVARTMAATGQPTWLYRFDYVAEALRREVAAAPHASELPYLFGTLTARYGAATTATDQAMSESFQQYLVNFVAAGDPNGSELPRWSAHDSDATQLMLLTNSGARFQVDPWHTRLNLVSAALECQSEPNRS